MQLRPYQAEAVEAVYEHLRSKDTNPCVVLKSLVIARIAKDAAEKWNGRVLILAHVKELLEQNADKIRRLCPELDIGVYSAGLNRRDTENPVIVAGIQSVYSRGGEFIGDEVAAAMDKEELVSSACREIAELARNRKSVLIFTAGVEHCKHVAEKISEITGEECAVVTGDTPSAERAEITARFKREPVPADLYCIAMLRPTNSPGLLVQCAGRGNRNGGIEHLWRHHKELFTNPALAIRLLEYTLGNENCRVVVSLKRVIPREHGQNTPICVKKIVLHNPLTQTYCVMVWDGKELKLVSRNDAERACEVCNGIGAEWMPEELRERIGRWFPTLVLAADIHDLRYAAGGDENARQAADVEMLDNGVKLANHRYRWFDPRRYVLQFAMLQFYLALRASAGSSRFTSRRTRRRKDEQMPRKV